MKARALCRWVLCASLPMAGFLPANARAQDADIRGLTKAYNVSGQALYREFAREPGNIVFSPYSIGTAMAMVRSGARGETERQMATVLHHGKSRVDIDSANTALLSTLYAYDCPRQIASVRSRRGSKARSASASPSCHRQSS
jgi:serpin B